MRSHVALATEPRDLSEIAYGFIASKALFAAMEVDLFTVLADRARTQPELPYVAGQMTPLRVPERTIGADLDDERRFDQSDRRPPGSTEDAGSGGWKLWRPRVLLPRADGAKQGCHLTLLSGIKRCGAAGHDEVAAVVEAQYQAIRARDSGGSSPGSSCSSCRRRSLSDRSLQSWPLKARRSKAT
jgi:hypothetical protein